MFIIRLMRAVFPVLVAPGLVRRRLAVAQLPVVVVTPLSSMLRRMTLVVVAVVASIVMLRNWAAAVRVMGLRLLVRKWGYLVGEARHW